MTFHKQEAPTPRTEESSNPSVSALIVAIDDLRESVDRLTDAIAKTLRDLWNSCDRPIHLDEVPAGVHSVLPS